MSDLRRVFPSEGKLLFDGGLNSKYPNTVIEINESPDCKNVVFSNGAVETRQGVVKLNSTSLGSFAIDGIYTRREDSGAETMVVCAVGSAYTWNTTTFATISSAQSIFSTGVRVAATQYQNHLFMGNGVIIPMKYNGAFFTRHGNYPPTTTAAVATAGTGANLTGTFTWKVTFVNSQLVESNVGPISTALTLSAQNAALTAIPVAPTSWGVSSRRIYRKSAGAASYARVATLSDNTTTVYDDGIADASLGTVAPTDNGVPPLYSVCAYHRDRLWVNDPSNLNFIWYSNLADPYTFASTNFIRVGDKSGEIVKTIAVYGDSILVGTESSLWIVYMPDTTAANWQLVRVKSSYGSKSPFCFLNVKDSQLFPATRAGRFAGFANAVGDTVSQSATFLTVLTAGSDLVSDKIQPDMNLVQSTYVPNITGMVYGTKAFVALTYDSGNTQNNRIYVYDFSISDLSEKQKFSWVPYTGLNASQFTVYGGLLYYGSSLSDGFVQQMDSGIYSDNGSAIDSYFWTKEISGFDKDTLYFKDWRKANLLLDLPGAYFMNITYRVDSDSGMGSTQQVDLDPGGSQWGVMVWGVDAWGGGKTQDERILDLGTTSGKRIQFRFSNQNTAGQRFKVHWMNLVYNVKGLR